MAKKEETPVVAGDAPVVEAPAGDPAAAPAAPDQPTVFNVVVNGVVSWGDTYFQDGTVLAQIILPPGAPFTPRFITRLVEDNLLFCKPVVDPAVKTE